MFLQAKLLYANMQTINKEMREGGWESAEQVAGERLLPGVGFLK